MSRVPNERRAVFQCAASVFAPVPCDSELQALYQELNARFFGNTLAPCSISWSRRLTRTAGNIRVREKRITLSVPLLLDAWNDAREFEVCGVRCSSRAQALEEILKHEMIHLWLHEQGLPCGHTKAFRAKARSIGQPRTRHGIALPLPASGWVYECSACGMRLVRRRRFGRRVACGKCCGRGYEERFRLRGRRLEKGGEARRVSR